ncbi:hypothetical protein [Paenibacillus mucilaginosus]|uniref:Uncharacterized protein n=1 Tax=Paenibacillus mucilaginosus (strain KNP414) TaxID=1036673 RepID=F8F7E4_PAEMK|nr:hypothetical protein [Paenibacillus mucilaginosus]AEI45953.1 hypothetical protein KNP414_07449 [Paenibacillus mucilaginosus KNP414]MCG7216813.1 hypothetical protein [Paenibacillus mucilaginosus]WDM27302.1 hypothetical protein KCX80_33785 [Paenibacillus mucilaginosus]
MFNVKKALKVSAASAVAAALLSIPVAASAASSAPLARDNTPIILQGPILPLPPIVWYLGEVNLFTASPYSTVTKTLPDGYKGKVASVSVTSSTGNASDWKVEIINNGTQIRFTTLTYARTASAKVVLTTTDGTQGYYKLTSVTLY